MPDQSTEVLSEIKKIVGWVDLQRKITKWSLISIIPLVLLGVGASIYFSSKIDDITKTEVKHLSWYDVRSASRNSELEKALKIAKDLLERMPLDFEGHYIKGEILIMLGDRANALQSFKRAEEIFPIQKYRDAVEALENE